MAGAIWETQVIMQALKHYQSSGKRVPLCLWRALAGAEVDLLVERGGRFVAIECPFAEKPDPSSLRGVTALRKFCGEALFKKGSIACRTHHPFPQSGDVEATPGRLIDQSLE